MRKVTIRKDKLSSCPARGKWVDTFIKLHGQKQSIANVLNLYSLDTNLEHLESSSQFRRYAKVNEILTLSEDYRARQKK
jgi:hypothetical protein